MGKIGPRKQKFAPGPRISLIGLAVTTRYPYSHAKQCMFEDLQQNNAFLTEHYVEPENVLTEIFQDEDILYFLCYQYNLKHMSNVYR